MPLVHAEELKHQLHAESLYTALQTSVPTATRSFFDRFLLIAKRHRTAVATFGRWGGVREGGGEGA